MPFFYLVTVHDVYWGFQCSWLCFTFLDLQLLYMSCYEEDMPVSRLSNLMRILVYSP